MVDEEHGIIDYLPHYGKNCMKTIFIKAIRKVMGIIKKKKKVGVELCQAHSCLS